MAGKQMLQHNSMSVLKSTEGEEFALPVHWLNQIQSSLRSVWIITKHTALTFSQDEVSDVENTELTQGHIVYGLGLGRQTAIKLYALGNSLIRTPLCPQVSSPGLKYRDKADLFLPFRGSTINKHEAQIAISVMRWMPWCIPHGALPSISFKMPQKELIHLKRVSNRGEARHFDLAQNWLG